MNIFLPLLIVSQEINFAYVWNMYIVQDTSLEGYRMDSRIASSRQFAQFFKIYNNVH